MAAKVTTVAETEPLAGTDVSNALASAQTVAAATFSRLHRERKYAENYNNTIN